MLCGSSPQSVRYHGDTAALFVHKPHSITDGIHHRHKGLADLRLLELGRTTMEESDLL